VVGLKSGASRAEGVRGAPWRGGDRLAEGGGNDSVAARRCNEQQRGRASTHPAP